MLEQCSFCTKGESTTSVGENHLAVRHYQKVSGSKRCWVKSKLVAISSKLNQLILNPTVPPTFSRKNFCLFRPSSQKIFSKFKRKIRWMSFEEYIRYKNDYKWSSRQYLILSTFYHNFCGSKSKSSHNQILSDISNNRLTELTRPPHQLDHLRRPLTLEVWQFWSYLDIRIVVQIEIHWSKRK